MIYSLLVFLHLVGVVVFLGGFSASLFLKARADRSLDPIILAYTYSAINFNDTWITPVSIVLILVGGFGATGMSGQSILESGWIFWSLVLFGASGLIFVLRALPIQHRLESIAKQGVSSGVLDRPEYEKLSNNWTFWATAAFLLVVTAFALMVFKPVLPVPFS